MELKFCIQKARNTLSFPTKDLCNAHVMSKIKIKVQGQNITVIRLEEDDFISLTNLAGAFSESNNLISKWISNKNTL